jgi:transcriptional regulator with XRE-family HTH domain
MATDFTYKLARKMSFVANHQRMTIHGLSQASHVSPSTIRAILNTKIKSRNPKLSTIVKLAHGFKMPLSQFMDFAAQRHSPLK